MRNGRAQKGGRHKQPACHHLASQEIEFLGVCMETQKVGGSELSPCYQKLWLQIEEISNPPHSQHTHGN